MQKLFIFYSISILCGLSSHLLRAAAPPAPPVVLTVGEGFENPSGFHDHRPDFSWQLPAGITRQTAYAIRVASLAELLADTTADLWRSGKVITDQSIHIPYGGKPLASRQKIYWQVRYWDAQGVASPWSAVATLELGLLENTDWKARWIALPAPKVRDTTRYGTPLFRPQYLRKDFQGSKNIRQARLYVTAKGLFEVTINGKKVGQDVLTPGWTPYRKRIETLTYDVTEMLESTDNCLGITLTKGWHSGRFGPKRRWDTIVAPPRVICQLEITDAEGNTDTIISDASWRATRQGGLRSAGLYDGEVYDENYALPGWNKPGYAATTWKPVITEPVVAHTRLVPKQHAPIREKMTLAPVRLAHTGRRTVRFDFGQNMVGVVRIKIPVQRGDTLRLRHGEILDPAGELFTRNLGSAQATDYYIARRSGMVNWQPRFTFHGFRYVEVSGFATTAMPELSWVKGIVQYSDFAMNGYFRTDHPGLNQLQSNIQWGLRGNFFDVPLDCPQRSERLGWTGDAQVFIPTSLYLAEVHAFWSAWLTSMREEQFANGGVPVVVPNFTGNFAQAGWSDACVIIPWELYFRTGDRSVLRDNYAMMQKWCDYHRSEARNHLSHMSTVGDWLQPFSQQKDERRGDTPHGLISTAFYAQSVRRTMQSAGVLGQTADSLRYQRLLDSIKQAFTAEFFTADGKIQEAYTPTQTGYLLALGFDLLPPELETTATRELVRLIGMADNHLRTGFLGTPLLAPVLDKTGNVELLYKILLRETFPSWLYTIRQGATTMWERWDGYTHDRGFAKNALSFNHYAYGAIGQWMYERTGGIAPLEAGYRKIRLAPLPDPQLKTAAAEYRSPYGRIQSSWRFEEKDFVYTVSIPSNTTAQIVVPLFARASAVFVNGKKASGKKIGNTWRIDDVASGVYRIVVQPAQQ